MMQKCAEIEKREIAMSNPARTDVNKADLRGMTPLHAASMRDNAKIVDILCSVSDIDVNPKDNEGRTPLMIACLLGNEEAVRRLVIMPDIDLYCTDDRGRGLDYYINFKRNRTIKRIIENQRKNPSEIQQLTKVKNIINKDIEDQENGLEANPNVRYYRVSCKAEKIPYNDLPQHLKDEVDFKKTKKKEKNLERLYSSENVENYKGNLDIDSILENIESDKNNDPKKIKNVREPTGDEKGDPNKIKDEMEIKDISNIEQDCSTNQNQDTLNATEDVDNTENKLTPKVNVESPNNIEEALEEEEHCECNDVNNCKLNGKLMEMFNNGESVEKMSEFKTQWMNSLKNESESYEKRKCGNDHTDDLKENSNDKTTDNFNIKGKTLCANTGCTKPCLHRCSRCLQVSFCSRACSIQFWPKHQLSCTPWQSRLSEVD